MCSTSIATRGSFGASVDRTLAASRMCGGAASSAAIPNLVDAEDLSWANGMLATAFNGSLVLGPLIGNLLAPKQVPIRFETVDGEHRITVPAQRSFLVVDDALPAGLEAVDLSLRTQGALPPPASDQPVEGEREEEQPHGWMYGYWEYGWWSPFDYRELRDDRVVYVATTLWPGTYTATYVARATTPGVFIRPPAHAEEMYNPAVNGRSDGGVFTVTAHP